MNRSSISPIPISKANTFISRNSAHKGRKDLSKLPYAPENIFKNNPDTIRAKSSMENDRIVATPINKSVYKSTSNNINDSKTEIFINNSSSSAINFLPKNKSHVKNHFSYNKRSIIEGSIASIAENDRFNNGASIADIIKNDQSFMNNGVSITDITKNDLSFMNSGTSIADITKNDQSFIISADSPKYLETKSEICIQIQDNDSSLLNSAFTSDYRYKKPFN